MNNKTSKLICGYGFVGKAQHKLFPDSSIFDSNSINSIPYPIEKYDICFVCVGTPIKEDGSCDTSAVFDVINNVSADLFIIRSTVVPGTTNRLNGIKPCVFQPDYIGETVAHPLLDESQTKFVILGGLENLTDKAIEVYKEVYNSSVRFIQLTGLEAEICKYLENVSIATTVTLMNTFYEICEVLGANYNKVREAYLADPRMSRYFTFVYPDKRGFNGKCIPKDVSSIYGAAKEYGFDSIFIKGILEQNKQWQR